MFANCGGEREQCVWQIHITNVHGVFRVSLESGTELAVLRLVRREHLDLFALSYDDIYLCDSTISKAFVV